MTPSNSQVIYYEKTDRLYSFRACCNTANYRHYYCHNRSKYGYACSEKQSKKTVFTLKQSLFLARNHSIHTLNYVTVCPLVENTCSADWLLGIDTFIDYNQDKQLNNNDQLLLSSGQLNKNGALVFPLSAITFTPEGQILGTSASLLFRYCSGEERGGVSINYSGQAKIVDNTSFANCD